MSRLVVLFRDDAQRDNVRAVLGEARDLHRLMHEEARRNHNHTCRYMELAERYETAAAEIVSDLLDAAIIWDDDAMGLTPHLERVLAMVEEATASAQSPSRSAAPADSGQP